MLKRGCPAICAALRHKYVRKYPMEYRMALAREHGFHAGMLRWRAMQAMEEPRVPCKLLRPLHD